jgi:hypothetical protein
MEISVTLPLDSDGFLRRECPHCVRQFKWHDGPANEEAEDQPAATTYYCPLCGQPAGPDSWWTQEQLDYAEGVAMPAAIQQLDDELGRAFKGMNSKHFKIKKTGHLDAPDEPMPLTEPDDMSIVTSPCHGYEPVKVPETESSPFYCLVCGAAFAV